MSYPYFFTWQAQAGATAMAVEGGQGCHFHTADGDWLDLGSLSYQASLGHGHRGVIDAIVAQVQALPIALPNVDFPAKRELAERLLALAPAGFSRVFFTLGGSEANENAIKIARAVTGRTKTVSRYRSYHGATLGALSLTGDWRRPAAEPGVVGAVHAMDCYCDRCPFGQTVDRCKRECARHIDELLELEGNVAAVVLEPVPGANGVLVPPDDYWPMVRAACDRHGALLVADEVLTGFGRTGRCFGFEHWDVTPDIITVAKALTAGYAPLGAVLVHERIADRFADRILACGLTNYGHPLGCAAGLAALDAYRDGDLYARAATLSPALLGPLAAMRAEHPSVVRASRGLGLLAALELELSAEGWRRLGAGLEARRLYLHLSPSRGTAIFAPPLIIEEGELAAGLAGFADALKESMS